MAGWGKKNPRSFLTFSRVKGSVSWVTQGGDEYANLGAVENFNEGQIIWIFKNILYWNYCHGQALLSEIPEAEWKGEKSELFIFGFFWELERTILHCLRAGAKSLPSKKWVWKMKKTSGKRCKYPISIFKIGRIRALVAPNPIQPQTLPGMEQPRLLLLFPINKGLRARISRENGNSGPKWLRKVHGILL